MSTRRAQRTVFGWIALLAILLVALMPAASAALSTSNALPWEQLCSATPAAPDGSVSPDTPAAPHAFDHCPYCALHADLAPPPDPRVAVAGIAAAFRALPVAFARAPRADAVRRSAQPRAPPRFV